MTQNEKMTEQIQTFFSEFNKLGRGSKEIKIYIEEDEITFSWQKKSSSGWCKPPIKSTIILFEEILNILKKYYHYENIKEEDDVTYYFHLRLKE